MARTIRLALTDFKLIFRDPSLSAFFALPFLMYGLIIWFVPALIERYTVLESYIPMFLMIGVIENTQMFCFISSMVLIDEKESDVALAYGIVPMSGGQFLISRLFFPYMITVTLHVILLTAQPLHPMGVMDIIILSLLAGLVVPVYVLGVNIFTDNRMQGMIYVKAFNMAVLLPLAAFFVPEGFGYMFGILPTHWVYQAIDRVIAGEPAMLVILIGFTYFGACLWLTARTFLKRHFI